MRKLRHNFLQVDERIQFGSKKETLIERYFDKSRIIFKDNSFFLFINHAIPPVPINLIVSLIYLDKNSNEYIIKNKYTLQERQPGQVGKIEIKIPVNIEQDGKELQRIRYEPSQNTDSSIYISISDL